MTLPASSDDSPQPASFEEALAALEAVVHELEEGKIGLAEALTRYESGVKLLRQCYQMLDQAERRIELLSQVTAEGEAITAPFDDSPATLEQKSQDRSRRRSQSQVAQRRAAGAAEVDDAGGPA